MFFIQINSSTNSNYDNYYIRMVLREIPNTRNKIKGRQLILSQGRKLKRRCYFAKSCRFAFQQNPNFSRIFTPREIILRKSPINRRDVRACELLPINFSTPFFRYATNTVLYIIFRAFWADTFALLFYNFANFKQVLDTTGCRDTPYTYIDDLAPDYLPTFNMTN